MTEHEWSPERLVGHAQKVFREEAPKDLADVLSTLQLLQACADDCLSEELKSVFGDYSHYTFDYYDMSFEVHGIPRGFECTKEQQERFWALGFLRFWTHVGNERHMDGERAYAK